MTPVRAASAGREPLPAFIIAGAKKCGTTTFHHLLAARPDVFLPRHEVGFFDVDANLPLGAYTRLFAGASRDQLCGERSTMYFASPRGPQRIAATLPDAKLIFLLRDPVARAYSHYWHRVGRLREGRAFEEVIRDPRNPVLVDSDYSGALRRYFQRFDRARIRVALFEELIAEPERTLAGVTAFLGLPPSWPAGANRHQNRTVYPRWPRAVLGYNRLRRRIRVDQRPVTLAANANGAPAGMARAAVHAVDAAVSRWAFSPELGRPALNEDTRARLGEYLRRINHDLSELIDRDLGAVWPSFRR